MTTSPAPAPTSPQNPSPAVGAAPAGDFLAQAAILQKLIDLPLERVDSRAIAYSRRYRLLAFLMALLGSFALLFSTLRMFLSGRNQHLQHVFFLLEAITTFIALAVVLYGMKSAAHHRWLLARHQTERLRALHAQTLVELLAAPLDPSKLEAQIASIIAMRFADMHLWLQRDVAPRPLELAAHPTSDSHTLQIFRQVYLQLRLAPQWTYLAGAESRHERFDRKTRNIPTMLFFLSIACVALHAATHPFPGHTAELVGDVFVLLGTLFPIVASGLRTYREAIQVSRNANRFSSKAYALELLRNQLLKAATFEQSLTVSWHTEQILESEHREWLRLMIDAEWFA
jgi:hypothetical protein